MSNPKTLISLQVSILGSQIEVGSEIGCDNSELATLFPHTQKILI